MSISTNISNNKTVYYEKIYVGSNHWECLLKNSLSPNLLTNPTAACLDFFLVNEKRQLLV